MSVNKKLQINLIHLCVSGSSSNHALTAANTKPTNTNKVVVMLAYVQNMRSVSKAAWAMSAPQHDMTLDPRWNSAKSSSFHGMAAGGECEVAARDRAWKRLLFALFHLGSGVMSCGGGTHFPSRPRAERMFWTYAGITTTLLVLVGLVLATVRPWFDEEPDTHRWIKFICSFLLTLMGCLLPMVAILVSDYVTRLTILLVIYYAAGECEGAAGECEGAARGSEGVAEGCEGERLSMQNELLADTKSSSRKLSMYDANEICGALTMLCDDKICGILAMLCEYHKK